ncbi:MAG TPA: T9SS type A sorting domain-containing protein, partial [Flavitalea sp.]|nr:T9SS type A sorting domain-containing protein [Flavitalea sp.]
PTTGGVSITGGYVYRGLKYPLLYGYYITADYQSQRAWLIRSGGGDTSVQNNLPIDAIVSFGETENGELFMLSQATNAISQVSSTALVPVKFTLFEGEYRNGRIELNWEIQSEESVQEYQVEYSSNGTAFVQAGTVAAHNVKAYAFSHPVSGNNNFYYRLKVVDLDGSSEYSKIVFIRNPFAIGNKKLFVIPSVINNGTLTVHLDKTYHQLQVISLEGKEVYNEKIEGRTGVISLRLPSLRAGHYIVRLSSDAEVLTQRVIINN